MTTNPPDRLDRIERAIEATQRQIDTLSNNLAAERDQRVLVQEDVDICFQLNQQTAESLNRLTERMDAFEQRAEVDREDFRSTFTSLLEALNERFRSNGHS